MNQTLVVSESAIVIVAKNLNPKILTPDFLLYSGIIPTDWELARQPVCTERGSQVIFSQGISIVAEPQRVMFMEPMGDKTAASMAVPGIASKYVQLLPNVEYQAVGLNFSGYVSFENQPEAASKYLSKKLLSSGSWQEVGNAPMRATLNLAYKLERGPFNLTISEAALRQPDETTTPIVMFSGNFSKEVIGSTGSERLESLHQAIENCQADLETYINIVITKFLTQIPENKVAVPDLFAMSSRASA